MTEGIWNEDGEKLVFEGEQKTRVRGVLQTDGMGRTWIGTNEDGRSEDIWSILPDGVEPENINRDEDGEELMFWIDVVVWKPTGEFREVDK